MATKNMLRSEINEKRRKSSVLLVAIAAFTFLSAYKDMFAAGEIPSGVVSRSRADMQSDFDTLTENVYRAVCQQRIVPVNANFMFLKTGVLGFRQQASQTNFNAMVKQCNGLLKQMVICLTRSLVNTLTELAQPNADENLRAGLSALVKDENWKGHVNYPARAYIELLLEAQQQKQDTFNFNLEREKREGLARTMNAEILAAVAQYNQALRAEGEEVFNNFSLPEPPPPSAPETRPAPTLESGVRGEQEETALVIDPDFEGILKNTRPVPKLYDDYKTLQKTFWYFSWAADFVNLFNISRDEWSSDYATQFILEIKDIRAAITRLRADGEANKNELARNANILGVTSRLERALDTVNQKLAPFIQEAEAGETKERSERQRVIEGGREERVERRRSGHEVTRLVLKQPTSDRPSIVKGGVFQWSDRLGDVPDIKKIQETQEQTPGDNRIFSIIQTYVHSVLSKSGAIPNEFHVLYEQFIALLDALIALEDNAQRLKDTGTIYKYGNAKRMLEGFKIALNNTCTGNKNGQEACRLIRYLFAGAFNRYQVIVNHYGQETLDNLLAASEGETQREAQQAFDAAQEYIAALHEKIRESRQYKTTQEIHDFNIGQKLLDMQDRAQKAVKEFKGTYATQRKLVDQLQGYFKTVDEELTQEIQRLSIVHRSSSQT